MVDTAELTQDEEAAEWWGTTLASETEYVRACYYGDPGVGKTTAAAFLATTGRTAFFPIEPGLKRTALNRLGLDTGNIIPFRSEDHDDIMEVFWALKGDLDVSPDSWSGAVFDSAGALATRTVKQIVAREWRTLRKTYAAKGEEAPRRKKFATEIQHFGEMTNEFRDLLEHYVDLPCHLAFTAHVRRDVDEEDGEVKYGPAVTPAVQSDLIAYMDILCWVRRLGVYDDGSPVIIGTTGNSGKYVTKDRFGILPTHLANPSMERLVAYVRGDLTAKTDKVQKNYIEWAKAQREDDE